MTNSSTIMVEVPIDDFAKTHQGLIMLLKAIEKAGEEGISTKKLCYKVFVSRGSFCIKLLEFARKQGYITRETVSHGGKRGHPYTINKITSAGRKLLAEIRAVKKKKEV
jgi:hypothetical protein